MEAVLRTFRLIECLASHTDGLGTTQLALKVGLAPSTAFRYLATLQEIGLVEQGLDRKYRLTHRLYALGLAAVGSVSALGQLQAGVERLATLTGETVLVTVRHGLSSICVAQMESRHRLKITARPGSRQDIRLGASGKVLLASLPEDEIDAILGAGPVPELTSETITSLDALRRMIAQVQTDGYCVSVSEIDYGIVGVAAPIHDTDNLVVAAISIVAPLSRSDSQAGISRLITEVTAEAARLSPLVGQVPPYKYDG